MAVENRRHEGEWVRSFDDQKDQRQHGRAPDPLMSNAYNYSTAVEGGSLMSAKLRRALNSVEMMQGTKLDEKKTRTGYKDKEKNRVRTPPHLFLPFVRFPLRGGVGRLGG